MVKKVTPKSKDVWTVICEEFLVLQEAKKDLTIKGFCNMREDISYNTARVRMPKVLKEISDRSREDQRKILPDGTKARANNSREHKTYEPRPENSTTNGHGIYSKYFSPELLEIAAKGTLSDDVLLYRSKAIEALDYVLKIRGQLEEAEANLAESPKDEALQNKVNSLEGRLVSTDKAISWCITRIEALLMTIKKIELTSVMIVKERANVVKTRAQTRMTLHQSNKYKADTKLAKVRMAELEKADKGTDLDDIIGEIQAKRDLLPSRTNNNEA